MRDKPIRYHVRLGLDPNDRYIVTSGKDAYDLYNIYDTKYRCIVDQTAYPANAQDIADRLNHGLPGRIARP